MSAASAYINEIASSYHIFQVSSNYWN